MSQLEVASTGRCTFDSFPLEYLRTSIFITKYTNNKVMRTMTYLPRRCRQTDTGTAPRRLRADTMNRAPFRTSKKLLRGVAGNNNNANVPTTNNNLIIKIVVVTVTVVVIVIGVAVVVAVSTAP